MDTLDDLLNDLKAVAHELGTDQPSPESTSSSSGSRDTKNSSEGSNSTTTTAESGFSSHNSSNYDFPTIKKAPVPPPPPTNAPNLDADFAEFDSIMSQLNTLDGQLESEPTEYVQPITVRQPKQPIIQTAKRVSFKSGTDAPPIPSKPKPTIKPTITNHNTSYGSSSNSNGPVRLPFNNSNQETPTKPAPPVRPRPSIPKPTNFANGPPVPPADRINNNTYVPPTIKHEPPKKRNIDPPLRVMNHQQSHHHPLPPPSPNLPPPAPLTPQCTLRRDGELPMPPENKHINTGPPPPPTNNRLPPPPTSDATQVSNLLEKIQSAERIRIFSSEGSYKLLPVERNMSTRYVTQLVAEKHRERLSARHSLLEYNPDLGTERVLEEHEKVCEVVGHWGQVSKNELHFLERKDKWLLFSHPQVIEKTHYMHDCILMRNIGVDGS
jgi:hypothetical protein